MPKKMDPGPRLETTAHVGACNIVDHSTCHACAVGVGVPRWEALAGDALARVALHGRRGHTLPLGASEQWLARARDVGRTPTAVSAPHSLSQREGAILVSVPRCALPRGRSTRAYCSPGPATMSQQLAQPQKWAPPDAVARCSTASCTPAAPTPLQAQRHGQQRAHGGPLHSRGPVWGCAGSDTQTTTQTQPLISMSRLRGIYVQVSYLRRAHEMPDN